MKKILFLCICLSLGFAAFGQDTLMTQQNFTKLAKKIEDVEDLKKMLGLIGLGGLTMLGVLGYMIFKFNSWGKEQIQKRLEAVSTSVSNDFAKIRLAIVSIDGKKRQSLVNDLGKIGFDKEKLAFYSVADASNIDPTKNEFIFFDDENNNLDEPQISSVIDSFESQIRYFYYGPKKVSNALYARLKIAANSKEFLESNFLKAVK
jgi:hypothetical protein